jgi:hypothetical protein
MVTSNAKPRRRKKTPTTLTLLRIRQKLDAHSPLSRSDHEAIQTVAAADKRAGRRSGPLARARVCLIALTLDDPALTTLRQQEAALKRLGQDLARLVAENGRLTLDLLKRFERRKRHAKKSAELSGIRR